MTTAEPAALLIESGILDELRAKSAEKSAEERDQLLTQLAELDRREAVDVPRMAADLLAAVERRQFLDSQIASANQAILEARAPLHNLTWELSRQRDRTTNRIRALADPRIGQAITYLEDLRTKVRASLSTGNEKVPGFTGPRLVQITNASTIDAAQDVLIKARRDLEALQTAPMPDGPELPMQAILQPITAALKPLRIFPDFSLFLTPPAPASSNWLERIFQTVKDKQHA